MSTIIDNALTSGSVLYYPTIEFQSDAWLKAAICMWEKVYRIVPASYKPQDSDEVKEAIDAGLVESIILEKGDLASTAEDFENFMEGAESFPAALDGHDNIDIRLHHEKIDEALLPVLESLGSKINPNGFLSVSEEVANAYMLFLATNIARRRKIGKATDDENVFSVDSYFQFDGNFNSWIWNPDQTEVAASVVLPQILPSGIETDSMARVLDFRRKYAEARTSFRDSVITLCKTLTEVESASHVQNIIDDFYYKITNAKEFPKGGILSKALHRGWPALAVGLPFAASVFLTNGEFDFVKTFQTIDIALIATLANSINSNRSNWRESDAFYHLGLRGHFVSNIGYRQGMTRITDKFHEFMDD